jgi:hypothetical protein
VDEVSVGIVEKCKGDRSKSKVSILGLTQDLTENLILA